MLKRYLALASLILWIETFLIIGRSKFLSYTSPTPGEVSAFATPQDAEGYLALGKKLPFEVVGIYELELLPKISDVLAQSIVDKREEILSRAKTLPLEKQHLAFTLVKGIAEKRALQLAKYLELPSITAQHSPQAYSR